MKENDQNLNLWKWTYTDMVNTWEIMQIQIRQLHLSEIVIILKPLIKQLILVIYIEN